MPVLLNLRNLVRLLLVMLFMLSLAATILMVASPAFAEELSNPPGAPVVLGELTPQLVAGLLGAIIPLLVSILARSNASATVKVWLNIVLTAALGALSALIVPIPGTSEAEFGWVPFLTAWLYAFVTSTITYLGALKHFDVNNLLLQFGGLFGQKVPSEIEAPVALPENPEAITVDEFVAEEYPDGTK